MVLGVGRRLLHNLHDAEDVLQATFLALARQASTISRREALGAWLHKVAFRIALRNRMQRRKRAMEPLNAANEPAAPVAGSESVALAALDEELQRLPEKYRTPLVLSYLQGLTNQNVAAEMHCPIGTVFTRLARGREMLRLRLVRRGVTLSGGVLATVLAEAVPASTLSIELARTTVHAAATFAAGSAAAVAPHIAAMTEGVLKMMWLGKMKLVAAALVLAIAAGSGAGVLAFRAAAGGDGDGKKAAADEQKPQAEAKKPARESLRYGGKTFEEWHQTLLTELKPEVRAEAIKAISTFGANGYGKEAAAIIVDTIRPYKKTEGLEDDQLVMNAALHGIRKIGAEAVPILIAEMKRGKKNVTLFAVESLYGFSPEDAAPALSVVIDTLKTGDWSVQHGALQTLRIIDREAKSSTALAALLSDKSVAIRRESLNLLRHFGSKAKDATEQLLTMATKDQVGEIRLQALETLQSIKPVAEVFLPTLKSALKDERSDVRWRAIDCIGGLGADAKTAIPDLIAAFKRSNVATERMLITKVLGNHGPEAREAVPLLTESLRQRAGQFDTQFNQAIVQALEKINK
jgi:RNA polymerase sigma factor (sigma-70 family)